VASAVRGRRYLHPAQPLLDELADGAAEAGGLAGLDEAAGVADLRSGGSPARRDNGRLAPSGAGASRASLATWPS